MLPQRTRGFCSIPFVGVVFIMASLQAMALSQSATSSAYTVTKLTDTNDGKCSGDCSLREAIAAAVPGGIVEFAPGLSGTIHLKSTLNIGKNLTISGPGKKQIIISGRNRIRVFAISSGVRFNIKNVTIADGSVKGKFGLTGEPGHFGGSGASAGGSGGSAEGAGLYNDGGVVIVENCTFLNNIATGGAGGKGGFSSSAYADAGTGGVAGDGMGGGIYNSGTLFVISSTFSANKAVGGTGGDGGAAGPGDYSTKKNDSASGMIWGTGGGGGNGYGGAIYSTSDMWIISCTLAANSAVGGIGGMGAAPGNGGFLSAPGLVGRDSGSANGSPGSGLGAAIYRPGALPTGKFAEINRSAPIKIKNTLIVGNGSGSNCEAAIESQGYNISSDSTCHLTAEGDQIDSNLKVMPLQYNGGPAFTHALPAASPAVNGGNPEGCTDQNGTVIPNDQRGQSRTWGGRCDIGAYEFVVEPPK